MNPITRKEVFLAAAGGQDVETPTPVTREEVFLDEIAKGGGGSSLPSTETASAGDVLSLDDNKEPQWAPPSGSGGGVLVVHVSDTGTLDKTWQEIHDAALVGPVILFYGSSDSFTHNYLYSVGSDGGYGAAFFDAEYGLSAFLASSASGYPVLSVES